MHDTSARVDPTQGVAGARGGHQFTLGDLGAKTLGRHADAAAQRNAVVVLKEVVVGHGG